MRQLLYNLLGDSSICIVGTPAHWRLIVAVELYTRGTYNQLNCRRYNIQESPRDQSLGQQDVMHDISTSQTRSTGPYAHVSAVYYGVLTNYDFGY